MSDTGLGYDPYQDMNDGDLIAMYAGMNPQLWGDDPAKRLNYYQDLMSSLGFDLTQLSGTDAQVETYQAPINQTGAMYASNPFYASIFQAIEDGADPISAAKAARDQLGFQGTDEDFNTQVVSIATQYASDKAKNQQAELDYQAKAGGGWTMPDGSKYKQSPLGGNDINATASEYDLLGRPGPEDLIAQYAAAQNKAFNVQDATKRGFGVSQANGNANLPAGAGWQLTGGGGIADRVIAQANNRQAPTRSTGADAKVAGGDFFMNKVLRDSVNKRVNESQNTRIRSDANINAMRRITALAGLLQGGFPQ